MKKVLIILMILCLAGCGYKEAGENYDDKEIVYLVTEAKSYFANGSEYKTITFEYDEKGCLEYKKETVHAPSKYVKITDFEKEYTNVYKYNSKGDPEYETEDGSTLYYEYDDAGLLTRISGDNYEVLFENNGYGNMVKREVTLDGVKNAVNCEYDENNNLIKESTDKYTITRVYDENGRQVSDLIEYGYGYPKIENEYIYDSEDHLIRQNITSIPVEDKMHESWYTWNYDERGNLTSYTYVYEKHSQFDEIFTYKYDENDRLVREKFTCDAYRSYCYSTVREYDDNGNLIKWSAYNIDDKLTGYTEYTYVKTIINKSNMTFENSDLIGGDMDEPDHPLH